MPLKTVLQYPRPMPPRAPDDFRLHNLQRSLAPLEGAQKNEVSIVMRRS